MTIKRDIYDRFSLESYAQMLSAALNNGYQFKFFDERQLPGRLCLLRHDIDADPTAALLMGEVEESLGVNATYFFMIRSPLYNLFSRSTDRSVRTLISMGHRIGLHYDEGYQPRNGNLNALIDFEIEVVEKNFECTIDSVSFHQPSVRVLNNEVKIGKINTYDKQDMENIHYISDSNMFWKQPHPRELFEDAAFERVQLLTHPLWWVGEGEHTNEKWNAAIKRNFKREQIQLLATEGAYGGERSMELAYMSAANE